MSRRCIPRFADLRRCLTDARGAAFVEFALAGPFLILMLIGLLETGRMLWTSHTLQEAVDEAGRYAMIHRTGDVGALTAYLGTKLNTSGLAIEITQSSAAGVTYVNIAARKPFEFAGGLFGGIGTSVGGRTSVPLLPSS